MNIILTGTSIRYNIFSHMRQFPEFADKKVLRIEKDKSGIYVKPDKSRMWVPVTKEDIYQADFLILPPAILQTGPRVLFEKPAVLFILEPDIIPKNADPAEFAAKERLSQIHTRRAEPAWGILRNIFHISNMQLKQYYETEIDIDATYSELSKIMAKQLSDYMAAIEKTKELLARLDAAEKYNLPENKSLEKTAAIMINRPDLLKMVQEIGKDLKLEKQA